MYKKFSLPIAAFVFCLTVLLSTFLVLPTLIHAAPSSSHTTTNSMITVSPTSFVGGDKRCTSTMIGNTTYQACPVTIRAPKSGKTGVVWTSSYTARQCYVTCSPDYEIAILPSQGRAYATQNASTYILFPLACYHGLSNATMSFAGPANKVTVTFTCGESE